MKSKIPSLLAIFALTIGLAAGVFLIQSQQNFRLSASSNFSPKDIRITNITDDSFTVSWYTDKNAISFVQWGPSSSLGEKTFPKIQDTTRVHYIEVTGLKANTSYYFNINSGGEYFDNSGIPWNIKTNKKSEVQKPMLVTGKVMLDSSRPANGVLVYLQTGDKNLLSTVTTENGSWVIPVSTSVDNTVFEIFVQGGGLGSSSALIYAKDSNPVSTIYLGKNINLTQDLNAGNFSLPGAQILLPKQQESRFEE